MRDISRLFLRIFIVFLMALALSSEALAQNESSGSLPASEAGDPKGPIVQPQFSDAVLAHHLNTIGTYSAGFVLQSFGYIGVLADVFSQHIYDPDMVRSMLGETITYLNNARRQLVDYQTLQIPLSKTDLDFIDSISDILADLVAEAEALRSFTESLNQEDLKKYNKARESAWNKIKKLLDVR
ncbi:MAG: hypothetical protein LBE31_11810 [Deltaproteobacteria bacterium]|jgi:hypothetical protein|nr:hypothetical protein [Deltaproteobacteria bacterium]